jgi:L,D-transpeptidase ErfK/SrfK
MRILRLPRLALAVMAILFGTAVVVQSAGARRQAACARIVGGQWTHTVAAGDTWRSIGARVGVDAAVLAARNDRDLRAPLRNGDTIHIDNRHIAPDAIDDGIVINAPQRLLFHYAEGRLRGHYPVALGQRTWQTPLGQFSVIEKETDPVWDVPRSIQNEMRQAGKRVVEQVPPGPANPLGRHWIRLSFGAIGLHGTTAPSSIYQFATHGCVRLHPDDIEDLFAHVALGTRGEIVYQPVLVAVDGPDVYLEVHRDVYRRAGDPFATAMALLERAGAAERVEFADVARIVREAEGLAVAVAQKQQ